ncbi:uncharacterized protein LOC123273609 isoform X2 [Cotesia glomerata]|uniref:uncharacterized protein LOC123273609 isoform X2 n=1 Tax=Cotesia glomerata TaxID=32391 RepID=UPI001D01CC4A|nr:uncharacterized protein LOC123273609 isoform X2 [Cotesia glomerata]
MREEIYLIGQMNQDFVGRKLPLLKEVMSIFFYHHKTCNLTIKQSSASTTKQLIELWRKTGIPLRQESSIILSIIRSHNRWILLSKSKRQKKSPTQKKKESIFCNDLQKLFDISHANVLNEIDATKKHFLESQRKPSRRGFINDFGPITEDMEICCLDQSETNANRDENEALMNTETLLLSQKSKSTVSTVSQISNNISDFEDELKKKSKRKAPLMNIMTPELAAALDRGKVSSRNAVYILAATLKSTGIDMKGYGLKNQDNFVLHWDGKILPDIVGTEKVDRLPIIISSSGSEQLLGVPKMKSGTAKNQADAIVKILFDWGISRKIVGLSFDTAAVNTGIHGGTCKLIEDELEKKLVYLPCRHHIFEIVLKKVFEIYWPVSSGPNVPIFLRFKNKWSNFNTSNYTPGILDPIILNALEDVKEETVTFITNQLQVAQPRDDYCELLELSLLFLNTTSSTQISFKRPGAMHHARWMAKAIYSLKIFMFRNQFNLNFKEITGIRQICIFVLRFYIPTWFQASSGILAPNNDLTLMKDLLLYSQNNPSFAKIAAEKMSDHLWYLSEELVVFSLFDANVSLDMKRKMVVNIKSSKANAKNFKRFVIKDNVKSLLTIDLCDLVSEQSLFLLKKFNLPYNFLDDDVSLWPTNESYQKAILFLSKVRVLNDTAERGVSLISEYNLTLTKDEEDFQYLLQSVKKHREMYPNCNKTDLT